MSGIAVMDVSADDEARWRIALAKDRRFDGAFVMGAPSRFYRAGEDRMGMTPSAWAAGGRCVTIRWAVVETSLGPMLVAATEKGVCRLSFHEGHEELAARFPMPN